MCQPSNSQYLAISPLDLGSLDLRESEYFLSSSVQENSTLSHHEPFAGEVSASSSQQPESSLGDQSSAGTEHDSDESLHLVALFQSTSEFQSTENDTLGENDGQWRPSFLTKLNLYIFIAALAILIAGLETIWILSQQHSGIASSNTSLRHLWTYGSSAFLAATSAIWDCIEYEARALTPWLRKARHMNRPFEYATIDYVSMNTLVVPFRSLARRDFLVATCAIVSLLFKALIVMSPSLITLAQKTVTQPAILRTRFMDDPSRLSQRGLGPLVYVVGHEVYGLPWPHGTSEEFVYQSIGLPLENMTRFETKAEGLSFGVECQNPLSYKFGVDTVKEWIPPNTSSDYTRQFTTTLGINISSPECNFHVSYAIDDTLQQVLNAPYDFGFLRAVQCVDQRRSGTENRRLAWVFGSVNRTLSLPNGTYSGSVWVLERLQTLVCIPNYNISDVKLAGQDDGLLQISLAEDPHNRSFVHVQAWDIMNSILNAHNDESGLSPDKPLLNRIPNALQDDDRSWSNTTNLDIITTVIARLYNVAFQQPLASFDTHLIESKLQRYCNVYATFLIHSVLMDPAADPTAGTITSRQQRLIVQTVTCQVMVGLCVALVIGLLAVFFMTSRMAVLSGDPGTIIGMATLSTPDISQFPRGFGATKHSILKDALLSHSDADSRFGQEKPNGTDMDLPISRFYQPVVLTPLLRGAVTIVMVGILVLLEVLLHLSNANEGVGSVSDNTYAHYLWTALPAAILTVVSLYFSSVDSELRALAPLGTLGRRADSGSTSPSLRLLGRLYPSTIYKELQTRKLAAAFATTCSLVASFLTVTSGSLFFEIVIPAASPTNLIMVDTFTSDLKQGAVVGFDYTNDQDIVTSLILGSNLSYPVDTYEGFAFQATHWPGQSNVSKDLDVMSTFDIKGSVPAIQSRLMCHQYPPSDVNASILRGFDPQNSMGDAGNDTDYAGSFGDRLLINITNELCEDTPGLLLPELAVSRVLYLGHEAPSQGVFAMSASGLSEGDFLYSTCGGFIFVWGRFESESIYVSAVTCNATVETVDVDVVFSGPSFSIDPARSPSARQDTRKIIISAQELAEFDSKKISTSSWYPDLVGGVSASPNMVQNRPSFLDSFFSLLTTSRNAIPLDFLATPGQEDAVIAAISLQHSIIMAQSISSGERIPLNLNSTDTGVFLLGGKNDTTENATVIEATVENYSNAQRRVVMSATATRVLEGLLAATLALALLAWAFMPKTAITPHPATSIMGMMALLVDSDLVEKWQSPTGRWNVAVGDDEMFRLGWGPSGDGNKGEAGKRFGIWAVPKETQKSLP